jgi:hypothetical protein
MIGHQLTVLQCRIRVVRQLACCDRRRLRRCGEGWESEVHSWAKFARTPGHDHSHDETNMPALLELLPAPGRATVDFACGEDRVTLWGSDIRWWL